MISTEEQLEDYSRGASDTIEGACDHPMGIIAGFLMKKHGNEANAQGYERKVCCSALHDNTKESPYIAR
jgi:hypothetical protein